MKYLLIVVLLFNVAHAQTKYYIRADTLVVEKTGGNGELLLKNSTRNVEGILTNIGGGRTAFVKPRQSGDTLFIGSDTMVVTSGGTVNSGTANRLAYYAGTGTAVSELGAIAASRLIVSDANGLPVASSVTATEAGYLSGVTSAIQTQLNAKLNSSDTTGKWVNNVYERNDSIFKLQAGAETYIAKITTTGDTANIFIQRAGNGVQIWFVDEDSLMLKDVKGDSFIGFETDIDSTLKASLTATGTPSSSTYLRGDNTWATPPTPTLDATPTNGSTNGIESNAVFDGLALKMNNSGFTINRGVFTNGSGVPSVSNNYVYIDGGSMTLQGSAAQLFVTNATANAIIAEFRSVAGGGAIRITNGASTGYLPTIVMRPDNTTQVYSRITSWGGGSGSNPAMTFSSGNSTFGGLLSGQDLFGWQNYNVFHLKMKTNGTLQYENNNGVNFVARSIPDVGYVDSSISANLPSSGTYTPTITDGANVTGSTLVKAYYTRVGDIVTVTCAIDVTFTSANAESIVDISLPVASALTSADEVIGVGSINAQGSSYIGISGTVFGDATNDRARFGFYSLSSGTTGRLNFTFTYEVL